MNSIISVEDFLQQKISEIQSRIPLKMNIEQTVSFSGILQNQEEKLANKTVQLNTTTKKYPLVSGSY